MRGTGAVSDVQLEPHEHHLTVRRTARYAMLGRPGPDLTEVWIVCHGFGQLARNFIRDFTPVAGPGRLIVAPEALSRFYLGEVTGATSATARIGATWMTREDRLAEIADYVAYLDALYARLFASMRRDAVTVTALGFSQGVAAACRWAAVGHAVIDRLVLWAGRLPDEFAAPEHVAPLTRLRCVVVMGRDDPLLTGGAQQAEHARLARLGLDARWLTFDGGHVIDRETLIQLAQ
jgi:predicted esterase